MADRQSPIEWETFLGQWIKALLSNEDVEQGSQGFRSDPASEEAIAGVEATIHARLPPTYRSFLKVSNGWTLVGPESVTPGLLLPVEELGLFGDLSPSFERIWSNLDGDEDVSVEDHAVYGGDQDCVQFRRAYLPDCFQISGTTASVYLLNPGVVSKEGEWEAWHLASWLPGACRYRSFRDLLKDNLEGLQDLI